MRVPQDPQEETTVRLSGPPAMHADEPSRPGQMLPQQRSDSPPHRSSVDRSSPSMVPADRTVSHVKTGLHEAEAARMSTIGLVFSIICFTALLWTPFLEGHVASESLFFAGALSVFSLKSLFVWYWAKDPERYTPLLFRSYGLVCVLTSITTLVYLGPFSPTALAITLGIGFFGRSGDRLGAWIICGSAILLCLGLLGGVLMGLIPDIGVFRGSSAGASGMGFMTLMVPMVLLVTLIQARWSREAVEEAMASAVTAAIDINLKNVQLEEAQAELERIFGADGLPGRMTGESIGGYRLGPLLGRGASGEVYDGVDQTKGTRAAVKLLNNHDAEQPAIIARFHQEGQITVRLRSPHVARVYRVGQDESGVLYIAMEKLEGEDLAAVLRRKGRVSTRSALGMVRHVCSALTTAHDKGVIHRDIKPHNIFRHKESARTRVWKVLDFGVSKYTSGGATLTQVGCVVGTPRYMSPEQAQGKELDHRSDIYSLGAVLYRSLTGSPPYKEGGFHAIAAAAHQRPTHPSLVAPNLPPQVISVLSLAMAPDPIQRFSTADDFALAFQRAYEGTLPRELIDRAALIPWRD